jgi:hypothetical protein
MVFNLLIYFSAIVLPVSSIISTTSFKEIVTNYDVAMILFTKSGTPLPALFFGYCKNKAATFYYRLYIMSKPDSHKLFGVILSQEIFSASSNANTIKASRRAGGNNPWVAFSMKKKEEALSRIADSISAVMVENQNRNLKHSKKMRIERDTGGFYMNIVTLSTGAR